MTSIPTVLVHELHVFILFCSGLVVYVHGMYEIIPSTVCHTSRAPSFGRQAILAGRGGGGHALHAMIAVLNDIL